VVVATFLLLVRAFRSVLLAAMSGAAAQDELVLSSR